MKQNQMRELVSTAVVALTVTVGFAAIVNGRMDGALDEKKVMLAALQEESQSAPAQHEASAMQMKSDRMRDWIDSNNKGNTESEAYSRLISLGESLGVRIDRMQPIGVVVAENGFIQSLGFTIDAVGSYEEIASFIAHAERDFGFSGIKRFHLTPSADGPDGQVHATLETVHTSYDSSKLSLPSQSEDDVEEDEP